MSELETAANYCVAETAAGRVRGVCRGAIRVFKGIPYGQSTAGERRFRAPLPAAGWMGVRDALEYGGSAPQRDPAAPPAPASGAYSLIGELNTRPESEDCLVLNVWTPGLDDGAKRPVMFWMHGGGFQAGTGSSPGYDGTRLAERGDVVVVTVNHRLNVLGFLWADDEFDANPGMQDLLLALQWVRLNMAAFGGDPTRVLAFGESGGGRKVGTLLAMPEARGLFQRAAIQSGPTLRVLTRERAEQARRALCDELQLPAASLEALQAVPLDRLMAAYHAASRKHRFNHVTSGFAPVVIGEQLPAHPFEPRAAAVMPEVPVIAGTNQSEMTLMLAGDRAAFELDEQGLSERVNALLAEHAESVLQVYRDTLPDATPSQLYFAIASDRAYCARMMTLAERRSELRGAPVYFYYLTWHSPAMGGRLGAPHALDVPLVFDNVRRSALTGSSERAQALADKMSDAWIAFARSGEPQTDALPHWQPYTAPERATLVLDDECRMERDPTRERRIAMQRALGLL